MTTATAPQAAFDAPPKLMVGMEIHVELSTRSKMWTSAPNVAHPDYFEAAPNTLLDPVVIGMPGTLPVMNRTALEMSMLVGLALNCEIARYSKWDRKSYYYPDLPKNYQLSQYDLPICGPGYLEFPVPMPEGNPDQKGKFYRKRVRILRAHLEEDAGKLMHEAPSDVPDMGQVRGSLVDLNRAGTPLLEIVTEPDIETADEAVAFGQALRDICRSLGVTEGIMQRGHMRFEPNINVIIQRGGQTYKTPIVEIKNLNSFKAVHGAIEHEYSRQIEEFMVTGRVMGGGEKSTRGWDDNKGETTLQREKEDAHEYRYFPDPDLVPVVVADAWLEEIRSRLTELPLQRAVRYRDELKLDFIDARQLLEEPRVADFFEAVLATPDGEKGSWPATAACKLILNNAAKLANETGCRVDQLGITPAQLAGILTLLAEDKVGAAVTDKLLAAACKSDDPAAKLAEAQGLLQVSDTSALEGFVDQVLAEAKNEKAIADIKEGKDKAIGALMGQIMKLSKGQANPKLVTELIKARLRG